MRNQEEAARIMESRAAMYRLLARFYLKEADAAFLEKLAAMHFPACAADDGLAAGYRLFESYLCARGENAEEELAVDYARIFLAAGVAEGEAAFPYESVYTSRKRIIKQEAWEDARRLYRESGVTLTGAPADCLEDHIGCELEYMAYLCGLGESAFDRQRAFLEGHLLNWLPAFAADVRTYASTDFYRAAAWMTERFAAMDLEFLAPSEETEQAAQSYEVSRGTMDALLHRLQERYVIYAPKLFRTGAGEKEETVKYAKVVSLDEIVFDRQSDFSPKEAYYPVSQTMFFFTESEVIESSAKEEKDILIFARPCDIHAIQRLDNIFLRNGGQADLYYARLRAKVKIVMMECRESFEHCFCVSLGTNRTDDYAMAVRADGDRVLVQVKDAGLAALFSGEKQSDFVPEFVAENLRKLRVPEIADREALKRAGELDYWKQFDDNCIGCGGCNTVCGTCSCFDTVDITYSEGSSRGERRRVWSSCMLEDFTQTAGGARARKTPGANMRFKVFHKFYDYQARFGEGHMCVGCGRCTKRCPQDIDFFETVNGLAALLEKDRK